MLENNHTIHLTLNGESRAFTVEPQETLLHVLRERAHLTGAKKGCDLGECGACTPGMIMAAKALLDRDPHPTREEIYAAMSGNLCRSRATRRSRRPSSRPPGSLNSTRTERRRSSDGTASFRHCQPRHAAP